MSRVDFDAIAEAITPEQLAQAIGARPNGKGFHCPSPNHADGDQNPSLSISRNGGRTVAHCHGCGLSGTPVQVAGNLWSLSAGDAAERLSAKLSVSMPSNGNRSPRNGLGEEVACYEYTDEAGEHLFEVVRFAHPKTFRQRVRQGSCWTWKLGNTRRVLYRLPDVVVGVSSARLVFVPEGEKDADLLADHGFVATTNVGGAGKWRSEYSESLRGARVVMIPDNDQPGREHAQAVAQALHGIVSGIRVLDLPDLPEKGDVSDWFEAGGTAADLKALVTAAPVWEPPGNEKVSTAVDTFEESQDAGTDDAPHLTDLGNAERLVHLHGDRIRFVREWGSWLVWDGTRWAKDRTGEVERLAQATVREMHKEAINLKDRAQGAKLSSHAFASEREARIKSMVSLSRWWEGVPLVPEELDADPWLFNVENGTIDLRTGTLREHRQEDRITKLAPVAFDPDATALRWDAFLLEVMGGNMNLVHFVQRAVGYSLIGTTEEHVLLFLYGLGANGKSTLLSVLLDFFGDYGKQSEPDLLLRKRSDAHPTGVAGLQGARLVATSEIDAGRHMAEAVVKSLTGGDRITARFMKKDFFEFEPSHTIWLAANYKPVIKGTDVAIWRRIRLIPFDVVIPTENRDHDLPEKLKAELPGILAWAVRGCLEWQKDGLAAPEAVTAATKSYKDDMDVLGEFIDEHCIVEDGAQAEFKILYEKYKDWTEAAGERKLSQKQFGQQLQERGFESQKHSRTRRVTYLGIRINTQCEGVRSRITVTPTKTPHVESIVNTPSHGFAPAEDDDYERVERAAIQDAQMGGR